MEKSVVKKLTALNLIILLIICIVFTCVIINNNYFTKTVKAETSDAQEIQLNTKYTVTLEKGSQKHFTIDITDSSYYVVETRGDLQVRVQVDYNGKRYSDFTSGVDYNGCIGFVGANTTVEITLQNVFIWNTGTTELQVRKQQAVLYGFNYEDGDINTIPDLSVPYNKLNGKYQTYKYTDNTNHDREHMEQVDSRGYKRINSEIVFYSGHGVSGGLCFPNDYMSIMNWPSMENCKVAVWSACMSANSDNIYDKSVNQAAIAAGARASIGWGDTISTASSKIFTDRLFNKLAEGATIGDACSYAKNGIIWVWDNVRDYELLGDSQTTIAVNDFDKINPTYPGTSTNSESVIQSISKSNINKLIGIENNYLVLEAGLNVKRYYKTINGYPTNQYFDTTNDGYVLNNMQNVESTLLSYNTILPINIIQSIISNSELNKAGYILNNVEKHIIYYIKNNVATPIEIQYCTYEKENGVFCEVNCINLNNGSLIDYSEICN